MAKVLISFTLNGKKIEDAVAPDQPLLEYVREKGCLSVKRGCETSNCGLCTVLMDGKPVLSCTMLAVRADGHDIVTLEGVQDEAAEIGAFLASEGRRAVRLLLAGPHHEHHRHDARTARPVRG